MPKNKQRRHKGAKPNQHRQPNNNNNNNNDRNNPYGDKQHITRSIAATTKNSSSNGGGINNEQDHPQNNNNINNKHEETKRIIARSIMGALKKSDNPGKNIKMESIQKEHKVTDIVIVKYQNNYYFNSFFSRLSVGDMAHITKSLRRNAIFVRANSSVEEYLKDVTNYMRQFKTAFYPCHLKPSPLLFAFKTIVEERGSDIEKTFSDGAEFVRNVRENSIEPTQFRCIIDLDYCEIIWRDENEIMLTFTNAPISTTTTNNNKNETSSPMVTSSSSLSNNNGSSGDLNDLVSEGGESVTTTTDYNELFGLVEVIEDEGDNDHEMNTIDDIDFEEEFEMDLMEERAENNLILEEQFEFISSLFNMGAGSDDESLTTKKRRPEFDQKFFPKSHSIFKSIEESVRAFVLSSNEETTESLETCLKYLYDQSRIIYCSSNKEFQLFEVSSLQVYLVHCLKIVRAECFSRTYHLTRLEHEQFKKIALANMKGAAACAKLMAVSSFNYFFMKDSSNDGVNSNTGRSSNCSSTSASSASASSYSSSSSSSNGKSNDNASSDENLKEQLGKWFKLSSSD